MTGALKLQEVNPALYGWMTVEVFGHHDEVLQNIWLLAQETVHKHAGKMATQQPPWVSHFESTDDCLNAAISMQHSIDLLNFSNAINPPILLGIHIAYAEKNSLAPDVLLRPGQIHLSEAAYQACRQDLPIKFRKMNHANLIAYKAIWKPEEFELASAAPHQSAPSLRFFIKLILILLTPFLLVLAYTLREPLQQSLGSIDGSRSIDHRLQ